MSGVEGDEIARKRIEKFANEIRPPGFLVRSLVYFRITSTTHDYVGRYKDSFDRSWPDGTSSTQCTPNFEIALGKYFHQHKMCMCDPSFLGDCF